MLSTSLIAAADLVVDHPTEVKWLIGFLCTVIIALVGTFWGIVSSRISKLEKTDEALTDRVGDVELAVGKYEEHVGAGDKVLRELAARVEKHMNEEEALVWKGIRDLSTQLNEMQISNVKSHAEIVQGFAPRLATIETKVEMIEKKMPNGELREAITLLRQLTKAGV